MEGQTMRSVKDLIKDIKSFDDIKPGRLPGYFFPKLIELGVLIIDPFDPDSLGNICYYLHLGQRFRKPKDGKILIDPLSKESIEKAFEPYQEFDSYILKPGQSVIAQTSERLGISEELLAKIENTTQLGRIFLNHASHGFIHPDHGIKKPFQLMIELTNLGARPVELVPGLQVFRMYLEKLAYPAFDYSSINKTPKLKMDKADKS